MAEKSIPQKVYDEFVKRLSETGMFKGESLAALRVGLEAKGVRDRHIEAFLKTEDDQDENPRT
jgi:SOS response regulatory protein OraA/RecX